MSEPKTLEESAIEFERARRNAKVVCDAEERPPHPPLKALTLAELVRILKTANVQETRQFLLDFSDSSITDVPFSGAKRRCQRKNRTRRRC